MHTRWNQKRRQNFSALYTNFYEFPSADESDLEIWCYTDSLSYAPGETVQFHIDTSGKEYRLEIHRDGAIPTPAHSSEWLPGIRQATRSDASLQGCQWQSTYAWTVPRDLASGGYIVKSTTQNAAGETVFHHHFFVVRPTPHVAGERLLLICTTSTWIAYNGWGGSSHYEGNLHGEHRNEMSPILSTQRPWARGQLWLPAGAPRVALDTTPQPGDAPRYPPLEWAYMHGYSKYYSGAGWASYERLFVTWAEQRGYALDVITQHDLHFRPEILDGYRCAVVVGHDEYWSSPMRDAMEGFIERGGRAARFGGNFVWQVRLEDEGRRQVCYKYLARAQDPAYSADPAHATSAWEDPVVGRPGAQTFGLNALHGTYAGWGGTSPRHTKGFTVYRPRHWAFENTDLYFGDTFGSDARIFGFEVDGVDFTFRDGLPYPTQCDGAPANLEILAMGPSANAEEDHGTAGVGLLIGESDAEFTAKLLTGSDSPDAIARTRYGAGMIAAFARGKGHVFNAGSCEWVNGLRLREPMCETVTANVLNRFLRAAAPSE